MAAATKEDIESTTSAIAEKSTDAYGAVEGPSRAPQTGPSVIKVHLALAAGYFLFAGGAIVGKFGVHGTSAIIFELFREIWSLLGLGIGIYLLGKSFFPDPDDIPRLLLGGLAFFCNQVFWFVALKLADPVTGSAWQTFLPILTALVAVILGQTQLAGPKALGILVSTAGAVFMVVMDNRPTQAVSTESGLVARAVSHFMFFLNIAGTSSYFVIMNRLGNKYNSVQTVCWSLCVSLTMLSLTAVLMFTWSPLLNVLCHADQPQLEAKCKEQGMSLPTTVYFPLFYEVVVCTLIAWPMLNWANQHTDPAVVTVYMGLHPAATTFICMALVGVGGSAWAAQFHIGMPRLKDLGIVLIVLGLLIIFCSEQSRARREAKEDLVAKSQGLTSKALMRSSTQSI